QYTLAALQPVRLAALASGSPPSTAWAGTDLSLVTKKALCALSSADWMRWWQHICILARPLGWALWAPAPHLGWEGDGSALLRGVALGATVDDLAQTVDAFTAALVKYSGAYQVVDNPRTVHSGSSFIADHPAQVPIDALDHISQILARRPT